MPVYEFKCPKCGVLEEVEESMSEIGNVEMFCIADGCWISPYEGVSMKRVFTAPATVFKGSGFYRNDSRPKPKPEVTKTKDCTVTKKAKTDDKSH
jgi:predicted nucleic acid-binding Zn ribbon protein